MRRRKQQVAAEKKRTFWDMFTLVENGKIKSTFLLYAFALSFVFLAAYGIAFFLLIDPIEHLFAGISPAIAGALECLVPSILGTAVCLLCQKAARNKALAPAAFGFLAVAFLTFGGLMLTELETGEYGFFFTLFVQIAVVPFAMGGGATGYVWYRGKKEMEQMKQAAAARQKGNRYGQRHE